MRNRKHTDASEVKKNISDPAAKKLVEWVILRSDDSGADFARYVAFIAANPTWPSIVTLRRKAEAAAFQERPTNAQVAGLSSRSSRRSPPRDASRSRARCSRSGDRKDAEALVREAWRNDGFSQDVESQRAREHSASFLTRADHKARMDRRLYEKDDTEAGVRAAARLGGNEPLIAKARIAMLAKGGNKAALDAVPAAARNDIGYKFARIQMLRRADQLAEAVALIKTIPQLDREPRSRRMVDRAPAAGAQAARRRRSQERLRRGARRHAAGQRQLSRRASVHGRLDRAALPERSGAPPTPISPRSRRAPKIRSRSRAAPIGPAAPPRRCNKTQEARQHYQEAARYPTAYYGQIARAKAGLGELALNPFPALSGAERNKAMASPTWCARPNCSTPSRPAISPGR